MSAVAEAGERLTLAETAVRLGISVRTLSDWVRVGRLAVVRLSRRTVYVLSSEVERLLRDGGVRA